MTKRKFTAVFAALALVSVAAASESQASFFDKNYRNEQRKTEKETLSKQFEWWPTDAKPSAVPDKERGGFWWMPTEPGEMRPWGNRGYIYVYKIIFDYKEEELPPAKEAELRPSLLIRKIVKNVKVYFDYDKADLREDALRILQDAVRSLEKNDELSILITGNADIRGSEQYNDKLARRRGESVKKFMVDNAIPEDRIRVVSRGKLEAIAPVTDLAGMQKDRNAQFMIAEVEEVMLPAGPQNAAAADGSGYEADAAQGIEGATQIEEGKYLVEEEEQVEGEVQVSTREYVVKQGDTLSKIAQEQLGAGHRWKYLYEVNKDRIPNPDKLRPGQKIVIPVE